MKRFFLLVGCFLTFYSSLFSQSANAHFGAYSLIRAWFSANFTAQNAEEAGLELDHGIFKQGVYVECVASSETVQFLLRKGVRTDILIADLEEWNAQRIARSAQNHVDIPLSAPTHFKLGSMGGFYTLTEMESEFASMKSLFPNLVSDTIIGKSIQNRPITAFRFAAQTAVQNKKPEILYTAVHHAREPGGLSTLVYFFWYLLEGYEAGDAECRFLLENRQIYSVPMVNPDGYLYNQQQKPSGGSLWRKNRRINADNSVGVDLNRNYGTDEFWNAPNNGSSTTPSTDTYRGISPFSEPETQAIRDFCLARRFKIALNYHTYSNLVIYPYSYLDRESPDSTFYRALAAEISKGNHYSAGRDLQTVGYSTRGTSDDWMYAGVSTSASIRTMTVEIGTILDGFWPPKDRIIPHAAENIKTNLQMAWSAASNLRPTQTNQTQSTNGTTALNVIVENIGLTDSPTHSTIRLTSLDSRVEIPDASHEIAVLFPSGTQKFTVDFVRKSGFLNGMSVNVEILITQDGVPRRDTLSVQLFAPTKILLFTGAGHKTDWSLGSWGVKSVDGRTALTDSPNGNYPNDLENYLVYGKQIDLRGVDHATLEFQTRWAIESNYDYAVVQVSSDGGASWNYLRTSMMKAGSAVQGSTQEANSFGFDGNFPAWIWQSVSLDDYIGKTILLRFGMISDNGAAFDGWYLADIALRLYTQPTSVLENYSNTSSRFVPHPVLANAPSSITLAKPMSGFVKISVFDMLGRLAEHVEVQLFGDTTIALPAFSALPAGVYSLRVESEEESEQFRFVLLR